MSDHTEMTREGERERFLKSFHKTILNLEYPPRSHTRRSHLARIILAFLEDGLQDATAIPSGVDPEVHDFFHLQFLPACESFAQSPEEKEFLVAEFLPWLVGAVVGEIRSRFTLQEYREPSVAPYTPRNAIHV